jgi:hypothetical protein
VSDASRSGASQQKPVPYGPQSHLNPQLTSASTGSSARSRGLAPTAWEPLTTKVTPARRHTWPSVARSTACPVKENTQLVQNSRVTGVSSAASWPASSTPPSGRSSRTRTPRSARGSQGTIVAGKSPSTSRTSSPARQSTPWTSSWSP